MTTTTEFSTPGATDIVAVRRFHAPAALVWAAHVEPDQVRRRLAQPHSPMLVCDIDLRVGGRYGYAWTLPGRLRLGVPAARMRRRSSPQRGQGVGALAGRARRHPVGSDVGACTGRAEPAVSLGVDDQTDMHDAVPQASSLLRGCS